MRLRLSATALNSDRFGVSDRATAVIASSVQQDVGMIPNTDSPYVVDKCKIRRDKSRVGTDMKSQFTPPEESWGLFLDGRKDDTLFVKKLNAKQFLEECEKRTLFSYPGTWIKLYWTVCLLHFNEIFPTY